MELDEMKSVWKKDSGETGRPSRDLSQLLMKRISSSKKSIYRIATVEMGFMVIYLVLAAAAVWYSGGFPSFFYKTIGVITIIAVPVSLRLVQSIRRLSRQDLSLSLTENLEQGLHHLRQSIRWYQVSSYIALVILMVLYFTDEFFLSLSRIWKTGILAYLLFFAVMTAPYLKWLYGRKIREMEGLLGQLKGL
jgi:hypothetical protein